MPVAIGLSPQERQVLNSLAVPPPIEAMVADGRLVLDDQQARDLRERVLDRLPVVGFDANYALTDEGRVLDGLSDKLFIP